MMNNDLGLGIVVSMKDAFSQNAQRIESSMTSLDGTVAAASERMTRNLDRIQKGTMMVGAGLALMAAPVALVASTAATQKALGELASLGVKDLGAIEDAAESFTNQWSGANKAAFITATYDVKSALSNLSDEAVGVFTNMAGLTAKATKATTQEMVGTFTTAYGIFKPIMSDMTDMEWATAFSGAMAQTVASFKTNGTQMADAIKNIGAVAAANNIPLQEQLAILGQLQTTMPGSEAGTLYKAFIMKAAEAGDQLGLSFTDTTGRLKGVIPILQEIKQQFPDLSQAAAQVKLKKAFGSDEAVKFLLQMSAGTESLESNIKSVGAAMKTGTAVTNQMASAMNQDIGARFGLIRQQMLNLTEILGRTLLPVVSPVMNGISRFILFLQKLAKSMPGVTRVVLTLSMALGAVLVVAGAVTSAVGLVGLMLPAIKAGFIAISASAAGVGSAIATYFLPVTAAIAGVVLAVYLLKRAWETNFGGIRDVVLGTWNKIKLVFEGVKTLISSLSGSTGQMSAELANRLKSAGLLGFVVTVFKVYYRVREYLSGLWEAFSHAFGRIRAILEPAVKAMISAYATLYKAIFSVVEIFGVSANSADGSAWRKFGSVVGTVAGVLLQGLAYALRIVVWNITMVVKALAIVVRSVVWVGKVIVGSLIYATKFIYKFLLPVRLIAQAFVAAGKIIYSVWQILTGDVSLLDGLKAIGGAVFDFLATPFRWARDVISGVWSFITSVFDGMVRFFVAAGERIVSIFMNLPIVSTLRNLFATVRSFFSGDMTFFEAGKKMLVTLGEGIWSAVTYPFRMLKNALGKLRSLLPFSDAKEGPLSTLTASGKALLTTLADGMLSTLALPAKVFSFAARGVLSVLSGVWNGLKSAGQTAMNLLAAPFRTVGNLWGSLVDGAGAMVSKAGGMIKGALSNLIPELSLPDSWSGVWNKLTAGATAVKQMFTSTFSGLKNIIGSGISAVAEKGTALWNQVKSGVGGVIQSVKQKASGLLGGAWNSITSLFSSSSAPEAKAAPRLQTVSAKPSVVQQNAGRFALIPSLEKKLIPTVFSAMLLLTPVMASAMPVVNAGPAGASDITPKIPVSNPYQFPNAIAAPSVPPVTIAGQIAPSMGMIPALSIPADVRASLDTVGTGMLQEVNASSVMQPELHPPEKLAAARTNSFVSSSAGQQEGPDMASLLEALLNKLDTLSERPVEVSVATHIDGRQVAEAVYKDLRERKIRNYETL